MSYPEISADEIYESVEGVSGVLLYARYMAKSSSRSCSTRTSVRVCSPRGQFLRTMWHRRGSRRPRAAPRPIATGRRRARRRTGVRLTKTPPRRTHGLLLLDRRRRDHQLFSLACAWLFALAAPRTGASAAPTTSLPGVTVLKPLCGAVPTSDNLASTCRLDCPTLQSCSASRQRTTRDRHRQAPEARLPGRRRGSRRVGHDRIGSNARSQPEQHAAAREATTLVIADGDIRRAPRLHCAIIVPWLDGPRNGVVTCLYRGVAAPSRTASGAVHQHRPHRADGHRRAAGGAHDVRVRRDDLPGSARPASTHRRLPAIADHLADDYQLRPHGRGGGTIRSCSRPS